MNKEKHILLDMDGVLSDFVGGVSELFNTDLSDLPEWNIGAYLGMTPKEFWSAIDGRKNFWAELKPYPWARELTNVCLEHTKGGVTIVTSPSLNSNCAGQKMWWIQHWFPGLARKFLIGPEKELLASSSRILIDDSSDNCQKFSEAGGIAIEFPQSWNGGVKLLEPGESRVHYIKRELSTFVQ